MRQSILDLYETSEFRQWAFEVVENGIADAEKPFLHLLKNTGGRVLDIGCGGGRISLALAQIGFTKIVGIDFSMKLAAAYAGRFISFPARLSAINGTAALLPFRAEVFDYVVCLGNLLSFIDDRANRIRALQEIERVLKPGGMALISVLHFQARKLNAVIYPLLRTVRAFQKQPPRGRNLPWLKKGGKVNFGMFDAGEPQAYWFTEKEILGEIGQTGLEPVRWTGDPGKGVPFLGALQKRTG